MQANQHLYRNCQTSFKTIRFSARETTRLSSWHGVPMSQVGSMTIYWHAILCSKRSFERKPSRRAAIKSSVTRRFYVENAPYGKAHQLTGLEGLLAHLAHRRALERRLLKELFKENSTVLKSKDCSVEEI